MSKNASTAEGWDEEYEAGRWAFLRSLPESGRYGIIGMWLSLTDTLSDVLDIGCGEGLLYERLAPMGLKRYVGMDLAPAALEIANVDPKIAALRAGDMHSFEPEPGETFSAIVFNEVLHFAEDPGAVGPVMAALGSRGLALIEDGSFQKSVFDAAAGRTGLRYARATSTIDAKLTAEDIGAELLELETLAREHGAALGAGYAFPLTIETAKNWTAELDSRGIVLAPVSALTAVIPAEISGAPRVQTGSLGKAPVNPEG